MRLFVFGIGGTGSRVARALVHLLAAGVNVVDSSGRPVEVIPMLLDTDAPNRDTNDCVAALELYQSLNGRRSGSTLTGFFSSSVKALSSLTQDATRAISKSFKLNYQGVENRTFRDFVGFEQIGNIRTKYLLETLYSDDNLNDKLTGGFLGNPNVGAVVLSGFKDTADFSLFATSFAPGDRIFLVGSIFGGTGAAGLPWLQKTFRSESQQIGAASAIRTAPVGALVVLPYFKVQEDESSRIDSNTFITKTKAALSYYYRHLQDLNAVYYLADAKQASYANHESGERQANAAHVLELLGALAIIDFASIPDDQCGVEQKEYYECAIDKDADTLTFPSLGSRISGSFATQLTQLYMLSLLDRGHFSNCTHQPWARENGFDHHFFQSPDYRDLLRKYLSEYFTVWLQQLASNRRAFAPFDLSSNSTDMSRIRMDQLARHQSLYPRLSGELLDIKANRIEQCEDGPRGSLSRFMRLWWEATALAYQSSYGS